MEHQHYEKALEIVKAQASVRSMTTQEMTEMVRELSKELSNLAGGKKEEEPSEVVEQQQRPVKNSIREKSVICLECGKPFKVLTKRHLETHGLTPDEYKEKWGMKKNQALIAKELARQRKKKMQEMELWKKREMGPKRKKIEAPAE